MRSKLNWRIYTSAERQSAIEKIKSDIASNNAHIISSNFFSDLGLSLLVEIHEKDIEKLYQAIQSEMSISEIGVDELNSISDNEWLLFISLNFIKGTGNLKIEIPNVPG